LICCCFLVVWRESVVVEGVVVVLGVSRLVCAGCCCRRRCLRRWHQQQLMLGQGLASFVWKQRSSSGSLLLGTGCVCGMGCELIEVGGRNRGQARFTSIFWQHPG
jgi:hypothetical protein